MNVRRRIKTIRLMEKLERHPELKENIKIVNNEMKETKKNDNDDELGKEE